MEMNSKNNQLSGGGVIYRQNGNNLTIAGKLQKLRDTKSEIRQAIIDMGVEMPKNVQFRDYPEYIRQIETTTELTLTRLKQALNDGDYRKRFPIGTEIPDIWNNLEVPLIVAHYSDRIKSSTGVVRTGVYLIRKNVLYSNCIDMNLLNDNGAYINSILDNWLNGQNLDYSSDELKGLVAAINIEVDKKLSSKAIKFFIPSTTEVYGSNTTGNVEGEPWEYFVQKTGFSSPSNSVSAGRAGMDYWLRTANDYTYFDVVTTNGAISRDQLFRSHGVVPACALTAD